MQDYIRIGNREYDLNSTYIGRNNTLWHIRCSRAEVTGEPKFYLEEFSTKEHKHINVVKYLREMKNIEEVLNYE